MPDPHNSSDGIGNRGVADDPTTLVRKEVKRAVEEKVATYKDRLKYFWWGLFALVIITGTLGVLGAADILRTLHNKAFPVDGPTQVMVSYEAFIELRGNDPRSQLGSLSFYAEAGQRVDVHARIYHRFPGEGDLRRVTITVDDSLFAGPLTELEGGFHEITNHLARDTKFKRTKNIHTIAFSLDGSQPPELTDEVSIVCVILVFGSRS